MDLKLEGKNALVTGSSKGIGYSIASQLHAEGCNITLNGRNITSLENSASLFDDRIHYCESDVTNPHDCQKLVKDSIEHWGSIDILVCNVGNGSSVKPGNENFEEWNRVLQNNFFSATNVIEALVNSDSKTPKSILCVSSIAGIESTGAPVTYSVAKSAINFYAKYKAKELAKFKISLNIISPGNILQPNNNWDRKIKNNKMKTLRYISKNVPMNSFCKPLEIAETINFILNTKNNFITGSNFVIDGGETL